MATAVAPRECAIASALELIGERWSLLIVREMFWGAHRFSEIARNTGAPRDILTTRLQRLVEAGVLEKRRYSEHPPRFEYHLTRAGRALSTVLMSIQEWSAEHIPGAGEFQGYPHGDHSLRPMSTWHCAECGEEVR